MAIAFPGAEGYGGGTQGARAGSGPITIYKVTNLNDSGPGSFREACQASGRRVVVFDVGGTISCATSIRITNPNITILGHTAPGGGITLTRPSSSDDPPLRIYASEVILRYIRIRAGAHDELSVQGDALRIGSDSLTVNNVILDHITCSWGTDETIDVYQNCSNVTIQWSIVAHALMHGQQAEQVPEGHGKGVIFGPGCKSASIHHTIMAHLLDRCPRIKTKYANTYEVVGNVVYNTRWWNGSGKWGASHVRTENNTPAQNVNYINNTYKIGSERTDTAGYYISANKLTGGDVNIYEAGTVILEQNGEVVTGTSGRLPLAPWSEQYRVNNPRPVSHNYPITSNSADEDYTEVLDRAGCRIPLRDPLDDILVQEIQSGTGHWIDLPSEVGGLPTLDSGVPWVDSDGSGLPDDFQTRHGNPAATELAPSGYLWIEEWAETLISQNPIVVIPPQLKLRPIQTGVRQSLFIAATS